MPSSRMRRTGVALALQPETVFPLHRRYRRATDKVETFSPLVEWGLAGKRVFDAVTSLVLLVLLAPFFLLIMMLVVMESPGPPIFTHERVGLHGRHFWIFKFRTMAVRAHARRDGMLVVRAERLLFKHKRDPRVTRLGRFLRTSSIDELPQLLNVLVGEMSLIGPRPLLKEDFRGAGPESPLYARWVRERHRLWPGLTGLWQVSGRNELGFEDSMRIDLEYVERWTPWLDAAILAKTLPAVLSGRGAY